MAGVNGECEAYLKVRSYDEDPESRIIIKWLRIIKFEFLDITGEYIAAHKC